MPNYYMKNIICFFFIWEIIFHCAVCVTDCHFDGIRSTSCQEQAIVALSVCPSVSKTRDWTHTAVGPKNPQCDGRLSDIKSLKYFFYGDTSAGGMLVRCVTHSEFLLLARFQLDGPWRMGFEYSICRN